MQILKLKRSFILPALFFSALPCFPAVSAYAEDDPRASLATSEVRDAEGTLSRAAEVYRNLVTKGDVPASVRSGSNCVAIFSEVITAAIGVGGTHGNGVAFCRSASGSDWGNPVFLNLTGGSIGLQAGVKSTDIVLFMTGENARAAMERGSFRLVGDLGAVAGSFDETFVAPPAGVVAYASTGGAFAGASVVGVNISHDEDEQKAVYGSYDRSAVFGGRVPPTVEKSVNDLKAMLPTRS